jgi:hypothetical protein
MLATIGDAYEATLDPLFLDSMMLFLTGNPCGAGCVAALEGALENATLPSGLQGWTPVSDSGLRDSWPHRGRALALMQQ